MHTEDIQRLKQQTICEQEQLEKEKETLVEQIKQQLRLITANTSKHINEKLRRFLVNLK